MRINQLDTKKVYINTQLFNDSKLNITDIVVYLSLATLADKSHCCSASIEKISEYSDIEVAVVSDSLKKLESNKWIEIRYKYPIAKYFLL